MSLEHAKKFILGKIQTDEDFRGCVVDFLLYRNFLGATDDTPEGELTQSLNGENGDYNARHNVTAESLQGYEYWVG